MKKMARLFLLVLMSVLVGWCLGASKEFAVKVVDDGQTHCDYIDISRKYRPDIIPDTGLTGILCELGCIRVDLQISQFFMAARLTELRGLTRELG